MRKHAFLTYIHWHCDSTPFLHLEKPSDILPTSPLNLFLIFLDCFLLYLETAFPHINEG